MGRYSQMIWLIMADKMPTTKQIQHHYSHLNITEEVKTIRRAYRKEAKKYRIPKEREFYAAEYFLQNKTLEGFFRRPLLMDSPAPGE